MELDASQYGVGPTAVHSLDGVLHVGPDKLPTADLVALLEELYCGPIAVEFLHLQVSVVSIAVSHTTFKTDLVSYSFVRHAYSVSSYCYLDISKTVLSRPLHRPSIPGRAWPVDF